MNDSFDAFGGTAYTTHAMLKPPTHLKGLAICTAGVLAISPDTLLIRLIDVDAWTLSFWRGLLLALVLGTAQLLRHRGRTIAIYRALGRRGLLAGALWGLGTICFVGAVTQTSVANVLIIIGAAPLAAALLGRTFLAELVPLRTWLAIGGTLAGVLLTVWGNIDGPRLGDLIAVGAVLCLAAYLTIVRGAGSVDMTPCIVLSGIVAALLALPMAQPASVPAASVVWLLLLCVIVIPVSFTLITLGPRYLPAHEVALIGLLETVLGPYLVWLVLDEHPGSAALAGGAMVLVILALHTVAGARRT